MRGLRPELLLPRSRNERLLDPGPVGQPFSEPDGQPFTVADNVAHDVAVREPVDVSFTSASDVVAERVAVDIAQPFAVVRSHGFPVGISESFPVESNGHTLGLTDASAINEPLGLSFHGADQRAVDESVRVPIVIAQHVPDVQPKYAARHRGHHRVW